MKHFGRSFTWKMTSHPKGRCVFMYTFGCCILCFSFRRFTSRSSQMITRSVFSVDVSRWIAPMSEGNHFLSQTNALNLSRFPAQGRAGHKPNWPSFSHNKCIQRHQLTFNFRRNCQLFSDNKWVTSPIRPQIVIVSDNCLQITHENYVTDYPTYRHRNCQLFSDNTWVLRHRLPHKSSS